MRVSYAATDARLRSPPRKDHRGVDLISDALSFGRLWYAGPNAVSNAVDYAKFRSRSHRAVIRVYDEAGNVIETKPLTPNHALQLIAGRKTWLTRPKSLKHG